MMNHLGKKKAKAIGCRYDEMYGSKGRGILPILNVRYPKNRHEAMVRFCPPAERLLEIGCGDGRVIYHIADRCKEITGIEISGSLAKITRENVKNINKEIEIIQGSIEYGVRKPDGWYDVIIWADVIEHVVDVYAAMKEIDRLLCIGGTLITSTPNLGYLRYRIKLLLGYFPSTSQIDEGFSNDDKIMYDGGHLHYFTFNVLKRLYKRYNIEPVKSIGFGRLGIINNLWPSLTSGAAMVVGIKQ